MIKNLLSNIHIEDDLAEQGRMGIEVIVTLKSGKRRYCWFTTPAAMQHFGNWIQGTQIPFHYGCAHMFVVAADLTEELIQKALQDIDGQGRLKECTMSLD